MGAMFDKGGKAALRQIERLLADINFVEEHPRSFYTEEEALAWYREKISQWHRKADSLRWVIAEWYGGEGQVFIDALNEEVTGES